MPTQATHENELAGDLYLPGDEFRGLALGGELLQQSAFTWREHADERGNWLANHIKVSRADERSTARKWTGVRAAAICAHLSI